MQKAKVLAWANSLFEDNAEYGYGMAVAIKAMRERIKTVASKMQEMNVSDEVNQLLMLGYLLWKTLDASKVASVKLLEVLQLMVKQKNLLRKYLTKKDYLVKKIVWIFGGDGWAYDIGYGGLDHVIASGENVNILVFDTEVYSNTGGQLLKSNSNWSCC